LKFSHWPVTLIIDKTGAAGSRQPAAGINLQARQLHSTKKRLKSLLPIAKRKFLHHIENC